jgi:hypothetical protein
MFSTRRAGFVALPAALLVGLSGCALLDNTAAEEPLSGIAACALGHSWTLDTADLAEQIKTELTANHPEITAVTANGTQTLEWGLDSVMTVTTDYTVALTATTATPDQSLTITQTHQGTASGKAYINSDIAIPRNWKDKLEVATEGELAGAAVEAKDLAITIPATDFDDSVGLELTCDGGTMTTHPRGGVLTQKWTSG